MGAKQDRLTYVTYRALGRRASALPEPVATAAAVVAGEVMARRPTGPEALRADHLRRVLAQDSPVVAPDPAVVERWTRRAFRAYARYWVEGARLPATPPGEVCGRMMVERGLGAPGGGDGRRARAWSWPSRTSGAGSGGAPGWPPWAIP